MVQDGGDTKVKFKVMSRKGNKQQLKELMIPLESDLAVGVREVQQQAKMEAFEEVKQRTLDYERRQEEEDYQGWWLGNQDSGRGHRKSSTDD